MCFVFYLFEDFVKKCLLFDVDFNLSNNKWYLCGGEGEF